jgi:hypothetical protein
MSSGGLLYFNASPLFDMAKRAYERTKQASDDRTADALDAPVAVILSAAALEAFIYEAACVAAHQTQPPEPPSVPAFGALAEEFEQSRVSVVAKFMLASAIFTGQGYAKERPPYQDFDLLRRLRNALVHIKTEDTIEQDADGAFQHTPAPIVESLRSKNILAIPPGAGTVQASGSLLYWASTRAVARWACNTAAEMVQSVIDMVPTAGIRCRSRSS